MPAESSWEQAGVVEGSSPTATTSVGPFVDSRNSSTSSAEEDVNMAFGSCAAWPR
eukprot:CAMPEP_0177302378 /NCGR_PEP_ID=MMETSP0368-20130122/5562_1 /TAXON_ID=447022 ORGANISM="Scrippsiella hangoei-like, Strain SHHI-4" /NCGR_SAMPLE_ID=MMETSP0368 /ASSEMBLY_ACC=CAM_ASM_000363 /LENGTH=54 /DNA_ID=CAMNT_0018760843 /DNA_START=386 /DNA_END=547 /DNA_ORIENTATION=+